MVGVGPRHIRSPVKRLLPGKRPGGGFFAFYLTDLMPAPTYAELLDDAKTALQKLLQGFAEVTVNGRRYRRPEDLRSYISWLEAKTASEARGGKVSVRRAVPLG